MAENQGYTPMGNATQNGIWSHIISTPFFPIVEPTSVSNFKLTFNQGYIFDYANADKLKDPIAVEGKEFSLSAGSQKVIYVLLIINGQSGVVESSKIVEESELEEEEYKHLPITSSFHDKALSNQEKREIKWPVRLAEFNGPDIKKLYLRDNLHVNFQKIWQLGKPRASNEYPIVALENSLNPALPNKVNSPNGTLAFSSIRMAGPQDGYDACNNLVMGYDYENGVILLHVPCPTAGTASQPAPQDPANPIAGGTIDPRDPNPPTPNPPIIIIEPDPEDPDTPPPPDPPVDNGGKKKIKGKGDVDDDTRPQAPPSSSGTSCPTITNLEIITSGHDDIEYQCFKSFSSTMTANGEITDLKYIEVQGSVTVEGISTGTPPIGCSWSARFTVSSADGAYILVSSTITQDGEYKSNVRGIYVREGETYSLKVELRPMRVGASACPATEKECSKRITWEAPNICCYTVDLLSPDGALMGVVTPTKSPADGNCSTAPSTSHTSGTDVLLSWEAVSFYGAELIAWNINGREEVCNSPLGEHLITVKQDLVCKPVFDYTNYVAPP